MFDPHDVYADTEVSAKLNFDHIDFVELFAPPKMRVVGVLPLLALALLAFQAFGNDSA